MCIPVHNFYYIVSFDSHLPQKASNNNSPETILNYLKVFKSENSIRKRDNDITFVINRSNS